MDAHQKEKLKAQIAHHEGSSQICRSKKLEETDLHVPLVLALQRTSVGWSGSSCAWEGCHARPTWTQLDSRVSFKLNMYVVSEVPPISTSTRGCQNMCKSKMTSFQDFYADRLFAVFDVHRQGYVTVAELLSQLSMFTKACACQKLKLIFDMYDLDGTSCFHLCAHLQIIHKRMLLRWDGRLFFYSKRSKKLTIFCDVRVQGNHLVLIARKRLHRSTGIQNCALLRDWW